MALKESGNIRRFLTSPSTRNQTSGTKMRIHRRDSHRGIGPESDQSPRREKPRLRQFQTKMHHTRRLPSGDGTLTVNTGVSCVLVIPHDGYVARNIAEHSIVVTNANGGDQATGAFEAGTTITSNGTNVTITWNSDNALGASWAGTVTLFSEIPHSTYLTDFSD